MAAGHGNPQGETGLADDKGAGETLGDGLWCVCLNLQPKRVNSRACKLHLNF